MTDRMGEPVESGDGTYRLKLPDGQLIELPVIRPTFSRWTGPPIEDDYGGKPVLEYGGEPVFAELAVLRLLQDDGWNGVWVDTYRNRYLADLPERGGGTDLPPGRESLLEGIYVRKGSRSGCWDVFAWRGGDVLFAESKWKDNDALRTSQREWLQAALAEQLRPREFLVVEWELSATDR